MAQSLLGMKYGSGQMGQAYSEWQNSGGENKYNKALALEQSGNDRFNVRNLPGGTFGQSVIDSAIGTAGSLADFAGNPAGIGDWANDYVTSQEINMGEKPKASWSWNYIANGLPRDSGNLLGSALGLALPAGVAAVAAPYLGIGAGAAAVGGTLLSTALEAGAEGGSKLREALDNGDSLDEAQSKARTVAGENLGLLGITNAVGLGTLRKAYKGLKGAYEAGRAAKAANIANKAIPNISRPLEFAKGAGLVGASMLNEGTQEALQQGIQDSVEPDKEYGVLPWNWNEDQQENFNSTIGPVGIFSLLGGTARVGARKVGQWLAPEDLEAPDLNIDSAPSFNIPRTANYNISDEVSDRNLAQSTESKLRLLDQAYFDEYGEHLNVTSMKRHWGTNSKHESGSAFDVADAGLEGTPERRRFLEAKASEIGLKPLDEYENPSDGATGGHMHFSDDGTTLNANTGFSGWSGNSDMDNLINSYAEQYGVDPALVAAVAEQESNFNQGAQSEAGAIGTMQLMPQTAEGLGVDPNDMAGNIEGGTKYLAQLLQQFGGDVHKALEAYNGGPGNVGIAQTMKYADEVMQKYEKFKSHKGGTFSWQGAPADISTAEDYSKLFEDNGFTKTDTARDFLENLRMLSQDIDQSKNKQVQQDSKKAEQALNSRDENTIQQTAESLGFGHQDNAPKQGKSPMPIQDISTHLQNNGWVEFGSKANADEFAKSDIAKGLERYSNTGFAAKGYNPYAPKRQSAPARHNVPVQNSAQPQSQSQSVSMLGEVVPPLPREELSHHQGTPLNKQEIGTLNNLLQNMPQNDQDRLQALFNVRDYDGIRKMIHAYTAETKKSEKLAEQPQPALEQKEASQGETLDSKEIDDLNTLMQDIPQEAQQRIQDMFSAKNYDGIRSMIRSYMAESASRDDIKSAKKVAQILMGNPKAMHSARGTSFSLNRLNDILANGSLSDINRMNNALAKNLRDNGENPYKVIKGIPNRRIEVQPANVANVQKSVQDKSETPKLLNDFLNTMSNKMVRRTHENTLNAKCKYKGQNMSKANRVEKMAANGEHFEQRGKKFFGVTSEGDFKATMGEYNYYKYLTQREKETNAQTAPKEAKQEQNTKPVNKPVQQEESSADTVEENTPAYGSDVAENVARMANGSNREAWIVSNKALNRTSESKNIEQKTQAKQQDSNSMRKELIEQAAANEEAWVNSKKSELHLEDDNDTVVKLTPQELKYYHDLIKKDVVGKPELYKKAPEDVGEMDDNVEMSKEQKQIYDENNGDRDMPNSDSESIEREENVKDKSDTTLGNEAESHTEGQKTINAKENPKTVTVNGETFYFEKPSGAGLPLAMYGNKKSHFGKGAEKKKTIYRTNRQQYGNEVEVRTDDGKPIKAHYALIPADRLIASNKADDTLSKNEAYPQDLQPRDRQRTAMRLQVDSMANSLRPEDLADSRNLNQGAPIVRGDLTVLNGNGRTLAIQRAYQTGKAEEYKQYLLDNAEKLGLSKSQVAEMVNGRNVLNTKKGKYERAKSSQPILVRVVDDLSEGDTQSVINSTTGGQRMGSTEQAKADAKKIKSDTLRKYAENNKGDLTTAANEEFLGDVLKDIVPVNERNAYLTKDGKINKDGLARAERALFSCAYGDESLLEDFGENLNEEARNMTNALRNNAPAIARLQQKIKEGNAHDIGLQKNLVEAVKAIKSAIKQNKPAQSIWEEQTMFDDTAYSPETIEIAKVLHDLRRSGRKLSAFMGKLADLNEQHGNPKDEDLFAGEELAEPSLMNDIPIANQYAEELTRAKYSREAENQLDNQGEKADNEEKPTQTNVEFTDIHQQMKGHIDRVLSSNFLKDIKPTDDIGTALEKILAPIKREVDFQAAKYLEPGHDNDYYQARLNMVHYFKQMVDEARRSFYEGLYVFRRIVGDNNVRNAAREGSGLRESIYARVRALEKSKETGEATVISEHTGKTYENYNPKTRAVLQMLSEHPNENQNSRDVSAFSFAENPLSEEALKAKAEFETPLDKLEKVSRERLRKVERNIQDFGKRIGVPVHFVYHPDRGYRGVCIHNGGIYINLNSNVPARRIFMHEFTHWLKASGKDNNQIFTALASVIETKQGTLNEVRMNEYRRTLYGGEEMSDSQIIEEIVADAMSNSESAEQIMKAIEDYNPDMNVSLWSKIKALWDKFCEAVGFRQNVSAHNQPELYPANQTGRLRQGLNNREMANFNTALNNLMRKIKDSEGNNVFTMDGTKLTIQGKPFGEAVKINSVDDYRPTVSPRVQFSPAFARLKQSIAKRDKEYMNLVRDYESGIFLSDEMKEDTLNRIREMVQRAAEEAGFKNAIPEQVRAYKVRTTAPPKKTLKVYKVFTVDENGRPSALFVSSKDTLPQNVWLDAQDTFHFPYTNPKGEVAYYVPSTKNPNSKGGATGDGKEIQSEEILAALKERGYVSDKAKVGTKITALAYRPGWHAGTLPFFPQGGMKVVNPDYQGKGDTEHPQYADTPYPNIHRYNQVVFECEMAFDKDYNEAARSTKDGDLEYMPTDGAYYYATNPLTRANPNLGAWIISGSLKIGRALTQEECDKILAEHGMPAQQWEGGKLRKGSEEERQAGIDNYLAEKYAKVDANGKHKEAQYKDRKTYQEWYDRTLPKRQQQLQELAKYGYYFKRDKDGNIKNNPKTGEPETQIPKEKPKLPKTFNSMASGWGYESGKLDLTKLGYTGEEFDAARKTLAPITYDDYGNVIPLSERFDVTRDDVRYSRDSGVTPSTDLERALNEANENLEKSLGGKITWRDELAYKLTRGAFGKTKKLDNLIVKTHKDLEYDRLVSQGKDPALYKNVGWLQKVFTSPRRIAKRVPLLMPIIKSAVRATERQERLRGEFNDGMNEIMRILGWNESPLKRNDPKMRERQDKLQRILMAGDLGQTKFTEAQLKGYGADQHVIEAYKLMRNLLAKAWKMANDIKEQNKYTTENFDSENMAAARLADLKAENPFTEIARTQRADGKVVVTFRTPNARKVANLHVSKTELDALKNNKNVHIYKEEPSSGYLEGMTPDTYLVSYIEKNPPMGKIEGYIPHIFNGYNLVLADKDGNVKFDKNGLPMIVSSHRSLAEAEKEGSRLAEKNKDVNFVVQPQMNDFMGSSEQAAILGDYSYTKVVSQIANGMNISLADAKKLTEGGLAMKSRGRFLGYTMKRKGVTGYEQNVYKATQMYFNQVARYVALDPFKRDAINYYNRTWGAFDDSRVTDRSINAAFAHRYINNINGVPTGVEKKLNSICHDYLHISEERASGRPALWVTQHIFTYPMTIAKLGILNMSSAILNLTQLVNLYGAMGEKTMSPEAYKRLLKQGFVGSMKAMGNKKSPEYKLLFEDMGLRYQIGIDVASGYSNTEVNGIAGLAGKFNRLAGGSMYLFKQSDIFTKGVTMLTAYHKALAEGKSKEEAIEYAKEINTKVNFDYSTADAPELFRALGPLGAVLLQFQKYPVKQLELFKDIFDDGRSQGLNRKRSLMRLAKYMTPYMAMSGIMGVPFISLIGGIANLFGSDDFDWDEWIKEHMIEEFGEDSLVAQSILYGGGAMFGFNVGSRVGVGDFGGLSSQESTTLEMLLGKSTLTSTVLSMQRQFGYGNYAEMLKALSPSLGNIAIGLKGEVHTTRGRMKYQYQNAYERALRMIGFNPVNESLAGDLASIEYSKQNDDKHEKEKAVDNFLDEPTNENARKLQELGVTPKTIQNEVARRTMNTHDLNKLKEEQKKEKEAKSKKKEKQYSARDYLKEMK